jgi:hypothetical protein
LILAKSTSVFGESGTAADGFVTKRGVAQGCARCLAAAGNGLHREIGDDRRCPDRADQRAPCQVGPAVEITLKYLPWRSFPGKVETILQAVSGSQTQVSGQAARLDDFYLV